MINKLKNIISNDSFSLACGYYPMVAFSYALAMFLRRVRPGIIATGLMLLVFLQLFASLFLCRDLALASGAGREALRGPAALKALTGVRRVSTIDILALMYFVYNLLSGIWCHAYGMPAGVWAGEFATGILTMVFYLSARLMSDEGRDRFYYAFLVAVYFLGILGLILFITGPQFYLDYLYDIALISKADVPTMRVRMHSVTGSIQLGYLSVAAMLASAHILLKKNIKKGTVLLFMGMLFAFLSNQRSAMVVAILVLVYVNYLIFFTFRLVDKKYFYIEAGVLGGGFVLMCLVFMKAIMKVYYRLVSLPGAIGQRSDQWIGAINNMSNLWLGNGLGANGHRAGGIAEHMIADGGLAKLFVEMGIIGTGIFVYMMILCFKYGVRDLRMCAAEVGILAVTLLQSIGSNMLEFQLVTPVFWFAAGVIAAQSVRYAPEQKEKQLSS